MGASPCRATQVTTACFGGKRVFVSSTGYPANFGGALAADALCQNLANAAGLFGTWKAWISDSMSSPASRFIQAAVPYRRVNNTLIAANWADLTDGALINSVLLNEYGNPVLSAEMWTATSTTGTFTGSGCNDFTSNSTSAPYVFVGVSDRSGYDWTTIFLQFCDRMGLHIYCFEQ